MFIDNLRQQTKNLSAPQGAAWTTFLAEELPTKKTEDWKYTDLTFLNKSNFTTDLELPYINVTQTSANELCVSRGTQPTQKLPQMDGCRWLTGAEAKQWLVAEGFQNQSELWSYQNYFSQLIDAANEQALYLIFDKAWPSEKVLTLNFQGLDKAQCLSNLGFNILVQPGVSVKLAEDYSSSAVSMLNVSTQYFVAATSVLSLFKRDGVDKSRIVTTQRVKVAASARYQSVHLTADSQWARHNSYIELMGKEAHADLNASYMVGEAQFTDHHTLIDHAVELTTSQQLFSGVISKNAVGVYNGKVWIRRNSQKANAEQLSRNLLLAKTAEANTKPELLIDADDVKAKHGATIGQLDQEELFYMQSRGLTPLQAREMVLKSYVLGVGDTLPDALKTIFAKKASVDVQKFTAGISHV